MPLIVEDQWISAQASSFALSELEDCAIGIDATYYLSNLLDNTPAHEPLLSALGGLTSIDAHINQNLDQWDSNKIIPFFIFDGQTVAGQADVSVKRGREANQKTDEAWNLYSQSSGEQAVSAFGANPGAFQIQSIYPLLQRILKNRGLHFLIAPYNASAQLAYFETIDSDQVAGVMGSQELLLYPINDCVIRSIDWENKTVSAISKKKITRNLAVSETTFIDALLMCGTSFLPQFPPLQDPSLYQKATINEAVNLLRTFDKSVANAFSNYSDILQQDRDWLDKYRKARLAVQHFIYIAESGEVRVNDYDHLTQDNHEYLGLQLPEELLHYQNTGLIGSRILNCITHGQIVVQPTLDGTSSEEYKKLVTEQIVPVKEQALGLIIPRVHRGIGHKEIVLRVWYDTNFSYKINHRALQPPPSQQVGSWDVKDKDIREFFPVDFAGPVYLEVLALANPDFVAKTISAKAQPIRGVDSTDMVVSVAIWRFLHLRGYVNDSHVLTKWGNALATTLLALREANENREDAPPLDEAALLAFELAKYGLLNGKFREGGTPRKGSEEDKRSLILISQCATLLKLRHKVFGYTGPLNKSLLAFRSLSSEVRQSDRDLIEAIVASMFMYGQSKRERDDQLEISHKLPFLQEPDISMGIAAWTFFDEDEASDSKETRATRLEEFPKTFVPFAESLTEDMHICVDFVNSINQGLQTLDSKEFPAEDKKAWAQAQEYLKARPF